MRNLGTVQLETPRLILRRFTVEDAQAMFTNWASDPEITRWMRWAPHISPEFTRNLLQDWVASYENGAYLWAIVRKEDGELIGSLGCLPFSDEELPPALAPGYCIGRAFWNKGYATEAMQVVMDYMVHKVKVDTMYCSHATENISSGRVMQKAGFTFLKESTYLKLDNTPVPCYIYTWKRKDTNGR